MINQNINNSTNNTSDLIRENTPIFMLTDSCKPNIIRGIYWIENVDKNALKENILECKCNILVGYEYVHRTETHKLKTRLFTFNIDGLSLSNLPYLSYDKISYMKSIFELASNRAKKISDSGSMSKNMTSTDFGFKDQEDIKRWLSKSRKLDTSFIKDKKILLFGGYLDDNIGNKSLESKLPYLLTEKEVIAFKSNELNEYIIERNIEYSSITDQFIKNQNLY